MLWGKSKGGCGASVTVILQIRVPIAELPALLQQLSSAQLHWSELKYPEVKAAAEQT